MLVQKQRLTNAAIFIILSAGSLIMIFPFVWMLSTSLKYGQDIFVIPPKLLPNPVSFVKYTEIWSTVPLLSGFKNSAFIAVMVIVTGTFTSSLSAFAFAKLHFPNKSKLFFALICTMMIPYAVIMIPQFVVFSSVGLVDTLWPLIIPGMLGNISMIFFLRQYMSGIPDEMLDAGKIDGCHLFMIFWKLVMPNCLPALAAQIILWFMGIWNDFLGPMIYLNSTNKLTVQAVLAMLNSQYTAKMDFALIMSGSVISVVPFIILFCLCQKYFVESLAIASIKVNSCVHGSIRF